MSHPAFQEKASLGVHLYCSQVHYWVLLSLCSSGIWVSSCILVHLYLVLVLEWFWHLECSFLLFKRIGYSFECLPEFCHEFIWLQIFFFLSWKAFSYISISSFVCYRLSSWSNFGGLVESRNPSISYRFSNLIEYRFLKILSANILHFFWYML